MYTVKIMLEFLHSPIWTYKDGIVVGDPEAIENDSALQEWCNQAMEMYLITSLTRTISPVGLIRNEKERKSSRCFR